MFWDRRREAAIEAGLSGEAGPFVLKRAPTLAIGFFGGLFVGMTSVGSGSLIIVALILLYPMLRMKRLVGTDLVQAIPLVASAALGHILLLRNRVSSGFARKESRVGTVGQDDRHQEPTTIRRRRRINRRWISCVRTSNG